MKRKFNNVCTLVLLLIGTGVVTVLACVKAPKTGATCGQSSPPSTGNSCIGITCSTASETCSGASNFYSCTVIPYTVTCTVTFFTLYWDNEGMFCGEPSASGPSSPVACTTTQSVGPGCL